MKPSVKMYKQMAREKKDFSFFDRLHGLVYIKWPFLYIGAAVGELKWAAFVLSVLKKIFYRTDIAKREKGHPGGHSLADGYHGKVVRLDAAEQLVQIDKEICLTNLETVIPYSTAKDIILKNPDHLAVLDCPCRSARTNPCLPLDVCIAVGEPFASLIVEHHPNRSRRITSEEAVAILREEEKRGHVHHAFFKDAMLGRFYAICNCCACCCGAMQANRHGIPMLAPSGYTARIDIEKCDNCGQCRSICPFRAVRIVNKQIRIFQAKCMGCGLCASVCPNNAIELYPDTSKGEPLEIRNLMHIESSI